MKNQKRKIEILVLSDIHLGSYGCHAKELLHYLRSVNPKTVVLNGDIIDIWQFSKRYWPKSHMRVAQHIMKWAGKGKKVYYITGNHDEMLRKFAGLRMGSLCIKNKLELDLKNGQKAWFFHGDVFDVTMEHSKWLAKLGAIGYDSLILVNRFMNFISEKILKKGKLSLSKRIKNSVKSAVKFISNFEQTCADMGIGNNYDYVVCGHIHQPEIRRISNNEGSIVYLNSGDWIESLTALEYNDGQWELYRFVEDGLIDMILNQEEEENDMSNAQLFNKLVKEFKLMKQ